MSFCTCLVGCSADTLFVIPTGTNKVSGMESISFRYSRLRLTSSLGMKGKAHLCKGSSAESGEGLSTLLRPMSGWNFTLR